MKQYLLLPEDSICVLPEEDGAQTAVSVFCERTLIVFPCSGIERVRMLKNVTEDRLHTVDCLELTARDALFDVRQVILVPVTRPDFWSRRRRPRLGPRSASLAIWRVPERSVTPRVSVKY